MHFMPLKKLTKLSGFDLFIFWTQCIYIVHQLKGMQSSKLGIWKVYRLLIEDIWKGYLFCSLRKQPFLLAPRHWDVSREGTSVTQRQKFHTDNVYQCLHNKSSSQGVPNANLFNFMFLLVDFLKCYVNLWVSSRKTQMLLLEKKIFHKYWLFRYRFIAFTFDLFSFLSFVCHS